MMRQLTLLGVLLMLSACASTPVAQGERVVRVKPDRVTGNANTVTTQRVATIEHPGLSSHRYAIRGEVKHRQVEPAGYLEMWSQFPDGKRFFSRTVSSGGPTAQLRGDSDWRAFELPFASWPDYLPSRLELNVVLPRRGTVELRNVRLVELPTDHSP